jgi:hypothetical protein
MDEEDFQAIIAVLIDELRQIGADEVADETNYIVRSPEADDAELMPSQPRLTETLLAFERFLAARDGQIGREALERIQIEVKSSFPKGAVVVPTTDTELARTEVNLLAAPTSQLRTQILGDPPAGAFLTGLATADWPPLRCGADALFFVED